MTPARAIEILDRALDVYGDKDVQLVRITGTANQVRFSADVRSYSIGYSPQELSSEIIQGDTKSIISPTDILNSQWPGGQVNPTGDIHVPRRGDKIVIQGRERNIQNATPFYIDGTLVRIELQVRGPQ